MRSCYQNTINIRLSGISRLSFVPKRFPWHIPGIVTHSIRLRFERGCVEFGPGAPDGRIPSLVVLLRFLRGFHVPMDFCRRFAELFQPFSCFLCYPNCYCRDHVIEDNGRVYPGKCPILELLLTARPSRENLFNIPTYLSYWTCRALDN